MNFWIGRLKKKKKKKKKKKTFFFFLSPHLIHMAALITTGRKLAALMVVFWRLSNVEF